MNKKIVGYLGTGLLLIFSLALIFGVRYWRSEDRKAVSNQRRQAGYANQARESVERNRAESGLDNSMNNLTDNILKAANSNSAPAVSPSPSPQP